jgi:putative ABC transport system permease protein
MRDVLFALRMMRRRLTATTTAILVIAIGIGANTAMFTVVNKVLLDPLPYPEPDRLVQLQSDSPMGRATLASVPKYLIWREGRVAFEHVAAYASAEPVVVDGAEGPQLNLRMRVAADFFPVFGVRPALGRVFTDADDVPRGPRVAVISHGFWQRRFGRDRGVLGRSLHVESEAYEVIGVAAAESPVDPTVDIWMPLQVDPNSIGHSSWLQVVARLRPGVMPRAGRRQMFGLAGEFHRRYPNAMGPREAFGLTPLKDVVVGESRAALVFLLGSVTFVLLIACANVANWRSPRPANANGSSRSARRSVRARDVSCRSFCSKASCFRWRVVCSDSRLGTPDCGGCSI